MKINGKIKNKKNKGFTLVELVVVIGILALLTVLAVVAYGGLQTQAREAANRADAATLARAINTFNTLVGDSEDKITALGTTPPPLVLDAEEGDLITLDLTVTLDSNRASEVLKLITITGGFASVGDGE